MLVGKVVLEVVAGPHLTHEAREQVIQMTAFGATEKMNSIATLVDLQYAQAGRQGRHRLVPADRFVLTRSPFAGQSQRCSDPVRIVECIQTRLAQGTEPALINGVRRVAFDLFRTPFTNSNRDAATGGTLAAACVVEGGDTGRPVFRRYHLWYQIFDRLLDRFRVQETATRSDAAGADKLEKVPATDIRHQATRCFQPGRF